MLKRHSVLCGKCNLGWSKRMDQAILCAVLTAGAFGAVRFGLKDSRVAGPCARVPESRLQSIASFLANLLNIKEPNE